MKRHSFFPIFMFACILHLSKMRSLLVKGSIKRMNFWKALAVGMKKNSWLCWVHWMSTAMPATAVRYVCQRKNTDKLIFVANKNSEISPHCVLPSWYFRRCEIEMPAFCCFQSTPLHLAAGYNRTRIVQLILQNGADVHAKDKGSAAFTFAGIEAKIESFN